MAERKKDADDRFLESMFESAPIADNDFSTLVVRKLNRRLWVRRLTLPAAAAIGAMIAFKPLTALFSVVTGLTAMIPESTMIAAAGSVPQMQFMILGAILLAAGLLGTRIVGD